MLKTLGLLVSLMFLVGTSGGCEVESDKTAMPFVEGQAIGTSKSTPYLYGNAIVGVGAQGPGSTAGGDFVDVGSPDAE